MVVDHKNDGTPEHPIQMPFVKYNNLVDSFVQEFYQFSEINKEYGLKNYFYILNSNGIKSDIESVDVNLLDAQCVLALIMYTVRAENFCDGALLGSLKNGSIIKWLKRLKDIDDSTN